ncbi:ACP S-malonyltransferase [Natronosporangium hydrolyticum]|uniref:[acyl-carrier-protein] S-malonyltransferase n=1 Tax=Natronosporangium hydrolyticum TaxID=2811111 RepID=A0A895YPV9_9ACTN|nr:ACP S-malonyltransferase [Natronosporangium hydrolyticum]QSB16008.1 ACP S-malonyltransferase [Natronosporangium hydrolyticum]
MSAATEMAVLFPGMGPTRFADLGRFLVADPVARRLAESADTVLGYDLLDEFQRGEGDYSEAAQVAFLISSLALASWAERELGMSAGVCTGASFGGKVAVTYAGAIDIEDAVTMTAGIARCLTEYFASAHQDIVTHSFARTPPERLADILHQLGGWAEISCYVDHDLHMVSLPERDLEWFQQRIRSAGGLPLYTMRPPMHCSVFTGLRDLVADRVFGDLSFADPRLPIIADQDGAVVADADGVRRMLLDSFVAPVRWPDTVAALRREGAVTGFVCGPDALFGRVQVTSSSLQITQVTPRLAMQPRRARERRASQPAAAQVAAR